MIAAQTFAGCAGGGAREPAQRVSPSHPFVLEQSMEHRWLNGTQKPEFTPFGRASWPLQLDIPLPDRRNSHRTIRIAMAGARSGDSASVTVRADGGVVRQEAWFRPIPSAAVMLPGDSTRMTRQRLLVGGYLLLPVARVWDLVPQVHPRRVADGARWTDSIRLATEYEGSQQTLTGVRSSVLVGDTAVAGQPVWIIRDSAQVRYTERELQYERTLDTLVVIERSATGTIRGTYLYDADLQFLVERHDTTYLTGEAVLRYPDGRSFRTPARYERTRRWTLYDPGTFAARQVELSAERRRTASGPVRSPSNEIERRLASGDSAFRDSLTAEWEREKNPDRREELYRVLLVWGAGRGFRETLEARRVAAGDSAFILRELAQRAYPAQPPIDIDAAQQLIRVMRDPGIPFTFGVSRDALYENLVQTLVTWPPALAPDSTQWRCVPNACRLLEDQWREAQEPRLRDVGLAALATRDPARWADTAIARAAAGSAVIVSVAQLANGVGATWPAAAKLPIPSSDADWRAWLAWSNAPNPAYRMPASFRRGEGAMRFEDTHATAIRFYQLRTGRDVVGELRRHLAAATDDSARMVYGTMVSGLGDLPTVDQVAAQFRSGSAPQITLASRALPGLFGARAPLADSATTVAILDRLIAASVDGVEPWPNLSPPRDSIARPSVPRESPRPTSYVLADSVPPSLRERWRDRVRFIGPDDWRSLPERNAAMLLTVSSVERVGPFVRVRTHNSGRLARQPNETPRLFYGGTTYYLLATGDGWAVVAMEVWMT